MTGKDWGYGHQCGGTMKVAAGIERPAVIQWILDHLGPLTAAPQLRAPPDPPDALAAQQPAWSYEPTFDLPIPDPLVKAGPMDRSFPPGISLA
jgi:hypothetical protein